MHVVLTDINHLRSIKDAYLPQTITNNATFIFEQDTTPFVAFLETKTNQVLADIRLALHKNVQRVSPNIRCKKTGKGSKESQKKRNKQTIIEDILHLGPFCVIAEVVESLQTPTKTPPSSNAGTPSPPILPGASLTEEPIIFIPDSPQAKQTTPADSPAEKEVMVLEEYATETPKDPAINKSPSLEERCSQASINGDLDKAFKNYDNAKAKGYLTKALNNLHMATSDSSRTLAAAAARVTEAASSHPGSPDHVISLSVAMDFLRQSMDERSLEINAYKNLTCDLAAIVKQQTEVTKQLRAQLEQETEERIKLSLQVESWLGTLAKPVTLDPSSASQGMPMHDVQPIPPQGQAKPAPKTVNKSGSPGPTNNGPVQIDTGLPQKGPAPAQVVTTPAQKDNGPKPATPQTFRKTDLYIGNCESGYTRDDLRDHVNSCTGANIDLSDITELNSRSSGKAFKVSVPEAMTDAALAIWQPGIKAELYRTQKPGTGANNQLRSRNGGFKGNTFRNSTSFNRNTQRRPNYRNRTKQNEGWPINQRRQESWGPPRRDNHQHQQEPPRREYLDPREPSWFPERADNQYRYYQNSYRY